MNISEKQILECAEKYALPIKTVKCLALLSDNKQEFIESCENIGCFDTIEELDAKYGSEELKTEHVCEEEICEKIVDIEEFL